MHLALLVGAALAVRVWYRFDTVFGAGFVRFAENDPWYHLRVTDHLVRHFPWRLTYDPYRILGGQAAADPPLFDLIVAGLALLIGGGRPSDSLVDITAACVPAVLGALVVLPVYGIAERLFSTRAALFAASLATLMPGQFLARSSLGFVDHHVVEILFLSCALCFLVRALEPRDERRIGDPVLAGVFLGAYLLSWSGGSLFVAALALGVAAHLATSYLAGAPSARVVGVATTTFVVAGVTVLPFLGSFRAAPIQLTSLAAAIALVLLAGALPRASMVLPRVPRWAVLLAVALAGMLSPLLLSLLPEPLPGDIAGGINRLRGGRAGFRVAEARPLTDFTTDAALLLLFEYGTSLVAALAGVWSAARLAARGARAGVTVLLVLFAVAAAAMVGQIRFAYYVAITAAVLAGHACDWLLDRAGRRQEAVFLTLIVLVFVPSALLTRIAGTALPSLSDEWHAGLTWLRSNSPEPFGNPDAYLDDYTRFSEGHRYPYDSAYGVIARWDVGYWITRIARRIPVANPSGAGVDRVTEFFLAEDEAAAAGVLRKYRARYVIVDGNVPAIQVRGETSVIGALAQYAEAFGRDPSDYFEIYYMPTTLDGATLAPVLLYYPSYYRTMGSRLYAFGGAAVAAQPMVAVYRQDGERKIVEQLEMFPTVDAAERFIEKWGGAARIVGTSPFVSCVSLEPLRSLSRVHASAALDNRPPAETPYQPPTIAIFEFTGATSR